MRRWTRSRRWCRSRTTIASGSCARPRRKQKFVPITVRENLTWEEVSQIEVNAPDLPGVMIDVGSRRLYAFGPDTVHIVGYVGAVSESELTDDPAARAARLPHRQERRREGAGELAARRGRRPPGRGQRLRPRHPRARPPDGPARRRPHADHRPRPSAVCRGPLRRGERLGRGHRRPLAARSWRWRRCRATTPTCSPAASAISSGGS